MKRRSLFAFLLCVILLLAGCSPIVEDAPEQLSLYATFYPIYAISEMIAEDAPNLELHCLTQPQDGCLRNYELSDWDVYLLAYAADGVIAGGHGLESFESTLELMAEQEFALAKVFSGLDLYYGEERPVEEISHYQDENPHVYMSLDGAMEIAENIADIFSVLDGEYAALYAENLENTLTVLKQLQQELKKQTEVCFETRVAVMNESLFYVANDYQLNVVASIERESGAGFYDSEMTSCLNTLETSRAEIVLIEKQAPKSVIDALEQAGYAVAKLDVMSTYSEADGKLGLFNAYSSNAQAIVEAYQKIQSE